jgi:diguanylate cyclase (GGDEF)-like protein/PAS domain S-box-containing protein
MSSGARTATLFAIAILLFVLGDAYLASFSVRQDSYWQNLAYGVSRDDAKRRVVVGGALAILGVFVLFAQRRRRDMEASLADSTRRFEEMVRLLPQAVFETDAEGRVTFVNQALLDLFGIEAQMADSGLRLTSLAAPEDRGRMMDDFFRMLKTDRLEGEPPVEYQAARRDGHRFPVLVSTRPIVRGEGRLGMRGIMVDLSERRRQEELMRESEERFRTLAEVTRDGILIVEGGKLAYTNRRALEILGHSAGELADIQNLNYVSVEDRRRARDMRDEILASGKFPDGIEVWVVRSDGTLRFVHVSFLPVYGPKPKPRPQVRHGHGESGPPQEEQTAAHPHLRRLYIAVSDLTERKLIEDQLQRTAVHDQLTGLVNRGFVLERLDRCIARTAREPGYRFSVLYVDLDRFKVVNDTHGHIVGDDLLKSVATRLKGCVRDTDTVSRFGGDEFVVLVEDASDEAGLKILAVRIVSECSRPFEVGSRKLEIGASIGIVMGIAGYQRADEVMRDADKALYRAKSNGRGRYEFFGQTRE